MEEVRWMVFLSIAKPIIALNGLLFSGKVFSADEVTS